MVYKVIEKLDSYGLRKIKGGVVFQPFGVFSAEYLVESDGDCNKIKIVNRVFYLCFFVFVFLFFSPLNDKYEYFSSFWSIFWWVAIGLYLWALRVITKKMKKLSDRPTFQEALAKRAQEMKVIVLTLGVLCLVPFTFMILSVFFFYLTSPALELGFDEFFTLVFGFFFCGFGSYVISKMLLIKISKK